MSARLTAAEKASARRVAVTLRASAPTAGDPLSPAEAHALFCAREPITCRVVTPAHPRGVRGYPVAVARLYVVAGASQGMTAVRVGADTVRVLHGACTYVLTLLPGGAA